MGASDAGPLGSDDDDGSEADSTAPAPQPEPEPESSSGEPLRFGATSTLGAFQSSGELLIPRVRDDELEPEASGRKRPALGRDPATFFF